MVKDREGVYIQKIEESQGEKEKIRLDSMGEDSPEHIRPTADGFLYCQNNEIYEYSDRTQQTEKILSLSAYGIYASDILYLAKNHDAYEMVDNHEESGPSERITLTMGQVERQTVTLGVNMLPQDLETAVTEFNRYNTDYRVEIMDYFSQTGEYEKASDRLKLDVATGSAPDIIAVSGQDYQMFAEKGVLADLYEFMEEDAECPAELLVQSAVQAEEDEGHLYSIAPSFQLHSM